MDISFYASNLQSIRQALGIATIRMSMRQDAQSVTAVIKSLQKVNAKTLELSVTPHLGRNIDLRI